MPEPQGHDSVRAGPARFRLSRQALAVAASWLFLAAAVVADDWGKPLDGLQNAARTTVVCAVFMYVGHRIVAAVHKIGTQIKESLDGAISEAAKAIIAGSKIGRALSEVPGLDDDPDTGGEVHVLPVPSQRG
jgi:hypothetical protein